MPQWRRFHGSWISHSPRFVLVFYFIFLFLQNFDFWFCRLRSEQSYIMNPSGMTTMSPVERREFENVASTCWEDVQYCREVPEEPMMVPSLMLTPFADAMDMASVVEGMMQALAQEVPPPAVKPEASVQAEERALDSPSEEPGPLVIIHHHQRSSSSPCHEDVVIQHIITHFLPIVTDEHALAREMNQHGQHMLMQQHDQPESVPVIHGVARRLSEITPQDIHQHAQKANLFLPFSADKSRCLHRAFHQGRVSESCGQALQSLAQVRTAEFQFRQAQHVREQTAYTHLTTMYGFIFCTAVVLFCRRRSNNSQTMRPVSRQEMRRARLGTVMAFSGLSILCLVGMVPPHVLLQTCVVFSAYIFIRAVVAACATDDEEDEVGCGCCCCGSTPEDFAQGNLTEFQMCCDCCGGTGQCCGGETGCCDGCGCCKGTALEYYKPMMECCSCACCADGCCGGGCCDGCCCGTTDQKTKKILPVRHEIYEGVPVQIV